MSQVLLPPDLVKRLGLSPEQIRAFCQRWHVAEVSVFGSVLRHDFRPDSDIDLLISYVPGESQGLLARVRMKAELEGICGREVDLMTKQSIEQSQNEMRRREILNSVRVIYVA